MTGRVLITGCSSGIGLDAARRMQAEGWQVVATCRQEADIAARRAEGMECHHLELADPESTARLVRQVLSGGRLDGLVNNAAFALPGAVEDISRDALRAIFEANLFGTHDLTARLIPHFREHGGRIVNISSVLGLVGIPWRGPYVATKFAMEGLTDVLRLEMHGTGVQVVMIEPGPIASRIRVNAIPHFERWVNWQDSARAQQYRDTLLKRLYHPPGKDRFELPPSAVSDRILRALTATRPAPRYYVTAPTWLSGVGRRLLSTRALDWVARRSQGQPRKAVPMQDKPLFYLVVLAVLVVLAILVTGIGGFAKGGEFNRKHGNRLMRWRIIAQAVAVALILLFLWMRSG